MKPTILVMEDEKIIRMFLEKALGKKFDVVLKENGQEGLEWMQQGHLPDIVITDLHMPFMDGYDFLKYIRASGNYKDVPVIVLSAMESTEEKIKSFSLGANDFIVKPLNISSLIQNIEQLISPKS